MVKYVKAASFNRILTHMNETECMFITAFRSEYSRKENVQRNKQLVADFNHWDLSFIKVIGGFTENKGTPDESDVYEYSYCVINNKYATDKFVDIAVALCKKYDQESVLITFPVTENPRTTRSKQRIIEIVAKYYDKSGEVVAEFNRASVQNITEYFTKIANKKFTLYNTEDGAITESIDVYGVAGRYLSNKAYAQRKQTFNEQL